MYNLAGLNKYYCYSGYDKLINIESVNKCCVQGDHSSRLISYLILQVNTFLFPERSSVARWVLPYIGYIGICPKGCGFWIISISQPTPWERGCQYQYLGSCAPTPPLTQQ